MASMKKCIAALAATTLAVTLTLPAATVEAPAKSIRISSYKGSTLEVGERSGLIIGPNGTDYTVTSSAPDTIAVEQVLTFWVAVAKAEGSAEITAASAFLHFSSQFLIHFRTLFRHCIVCQRLNKNRKMEEMR